MPCPQCVGVERRFGRGTARRDLRRYRLRGPSPTTAELLNAIVSTAGGVEGASFLDVGGGVGAIQQALLDAGASHGTSVDASPEYVAAAREEAEARGRAERVTYLEGDFVALADRVEPADLVTLDRVICCYEDMPGLVDASAARARTVYGIVIPRDRWPVRLGIALINALHALARHPFRAFVHPPEEIETHLRALGFRRAHATSTFVWLVRVYVRAGDRSHDDVTPSSGG